MSSSAYENTVFQKMLSFELSPQSLEIQDGPLRMLRLTQSSGQWTSIHSTLVFEQGCIIDNSKAGANTNNPMKYRFCLPGSLEMNHLIVALS